MRVGALTDGHNQVLPEFKGFQPLWMADHDCYSDDTTLDERAEILEAKEMEQSCIRRFLELEEGGRLTNPQLHRRSTYWLLMALGNALDVMTGRGFEGWPRGPKLFLPLFMILRRRWCNPTEKTSLGLGRWWQIKLPTDLQQLLSCSMFRP